FLAMNAADRFRLHKEKQAFLDDLRPKYILTYLVENSILSKYESELISSEKTRRDQVEKLFEILPKKSPKAFKYFIEALNEKDRYGCANYPWLAEKLAQQDEVDLNRKVHETLIQGGVPFPTNFLFRREEKIREIRNHLCIASREDRQWVILYGMTGTGKSVLAAECLRCNELIEQHYSGGIFWISIGRIKDDNALWLKMKRLFNLLGVNKELYASEDLQDLTIVIRKEIIKRKKILLVLDDVWDKKVIKAFDIGCPVLVTTKLKDVLQNDSKYYTFIECKNDWSVNESKELLSLYVNCDREQLPDFVDYICEKCKGSPMTISLIGSMMSEHGNNFKRWENLKNKLEKGISKTIRQRHGSGDGLSDIKEIVRFSFEPIQELWKYFLDFIIFPDDIFVPNKVFEVMWGMDSFEVEDILHNLHSKSLVQIEKDSFDDSYGYCIHDLYLEILKEDHPDESLSDLISTGGLESVDASRSESVDISGLEFVIVGRSEFVDGGESEFVDEYHKKLVNSYMNLCKQDNGEYNFSLLPQDGYIHYHIGYHMYHALEYEKLETLYLDFQFIETKLHLDPKDLSWDYIAYSFCFQNIYLSSTGEEVQTLSGHKDVINYCSFNSKGDKLATASSDRTVKVFEINTSELLNMKPKRKRSSIPVPFVNNHTQDKSALSFEEHCSDAICCAFSPSDAHIISSDNIGIAYVWETATKHIKHKIIHSYRGEPVNYCCFNPDGSQVGTAANDSIKLWNFKTGFLKITFSHDDFLVRKFCFTKNGNNLLSVCNNIIYCWDMSGDCTRIKTGPSKPFEICCCCISPDGNYLAYGTSLSSVFVINVNTQKIIDSLKGHSDAILNVMFSNDGRRLLSLSEDRFIVHDMSSVKDASLVSFEGCLSVRMNKDLSISCAHSLNRVECKMELTTLFEQTVDCA
ncbi:apoptotic protease-activating factor 1-like, partial [Uloborus diversus]|uniref:apoptotic protease-activating factor 1-like n=1 Tax=Uloborus diversus TaxID=327109 RepID=UPI002409E3F3